MRAGEGQDPIPRSSFCPVPHTCGPTFSPFLPSSCLLSSQQARGLQGGLLGSEQPLPPSHWAAPWERVLGCPVALATRANPHCLHGMSPAGAAHTDFDFV